MATIQRDPEPELRFTFTDRHVVLTLATLATALFAFATRLRLNEKPWGDEPHYLIMSIALSKYHTFDLNRAYDNQDYRSFYPEQIDKHIFPNADGVMVPLHNFGGPLLWMFPFQWWGRAGAAAVVVAASVLTIVNIYRLLRELGIVKAYAGIVTGMFIVGTPIYMYASMQFIEPLGALPVVFAARAVLMDRPSWLRVAVASAGLGYLPWIHGRLIIFTAILGALLVLRVDPRSWRRYFPACVPLVVIFLALEIFNLARYGSLNPAPGNDALGDGLFQIPLQTGLAGLLFDRQFGLLSHFPLLALAVPGMLLALRRRVTPRHLVLMGTVLAYVLAVGTFKSWWAGWSPPGRLLAVLTPLLAYYVAVVLQRVHVWLATTLAAVFALGGFLYSVTGDYHTVARFTESAGAGNDPVLNRLADRLHLGDIALLLPAVRKTPDTGGYVLWYIGLALFVAIVFLAGWYHPAARVPMRSAAGLFPVLGLIRWPGPTRSTPAAAAQATEETAEPSTTTEAGRRTPRAAPADEPGTETPPPHATAQPPRATSETSPDATSEPPPSDHGRSS